MPSFRYARNFIFESELESLVVQRWLWNLGAEDICLVSAWINRNEKKFVLQWLQGPEEYRVCDFLESSQYQSDLDELNRR